MNSKGDSTDKVEKPVITIQSDWDEVLREKKGEAWISSKFRGEKGVYSKLISDGKTINGVPKLLPNEEFVITNITRKTLTVTQKNSTNSYYFVAPTATFSSLHSKSILSLDTSNGGLGLSVCLENKMIIWDTTRGLIRRNLEGHLGDVYICRLFPSGIVVLSSGADMQIKIWSAENGSCPVTMKGHKGAVTDLAVVEIGRNIISVSKDGTAKLWDCGKSECLGTLCEVPGIINCCTLFSANEKMKLNQVEREINPREIATGDKVLALGCENGSLVLVDVRARKILTTITGTSSINALGILEDLKLIVCREDGTVTLYQLGHNEPQIIRIWHESNSPIRSLLVSPKDGSRGFFVGRQDGTCTYIHPEWESLRLSLTGSDNDPINSMSCDASHLFTAARDGKVRKYDILDVMTKIIEKF